MNKEKIKNTIKDYLSFSQIERRGILILLALISIICLSTKLIGRLIPEKPEIDISRYSNEISAFEKILDTVSNNNKNYFPKKADTSRRKNIPEYKRKIFTIVELNAADSAALDSLPGIGPVFAQRIIKYRKILGGFYSKQQLKEVFGLNAELVEKLSEHIIIDTSKIRKINLNTATFKEINAHPYISFEQTKAICKLRSKVKLLTIKELTTEKIFSNDESQKLTPYIGY